jgi:hypothetical protein
VKSGVGRIALTTEKLNHREHRGGTEDTGGGVTANLEDWHPWFYLGGGQSTMFVKTGIESCLETGMVQIGVGAMISGDGFRR